MAGKGSCKCSDLPSDLLHLIYIKLSDISDRIRFRTVCKTWQSSVSTSDSSPCLPWLLSHSLDGNKEILYYSLSSKKTYKIYCPQLTDAYFCGTVGSFIVCSRGGCSVSLFNPLTRLEISLPSPQYFEVLGVASNPLREDLAVFLGPVQQSTDEMFVGFIRPGDVSWVINISEPIYYGKVSVYYDGLYYVSEYGADTRIIDATTREVITTIPSPEIGSHLISYQYMLETCGEILIIYRHKTNSKLEEIDFDIYRLVEVKENYQWIKVRSIGDRMLFLDSIGGFSLRASYFSTFRRNCIYFQLQEDDDLARNNIIPLCRHDLENGTTEVLPNFWGKQGKWIIPSFD